MSCKHCKINNWSIRSHLEHDCSAAKRRGVPTVIDGGRPMEGRSRVSIAIVPPSLCWMSIRKPRPDSKRIRTYTLQREKQACERSIAQPQVRFPAHIAPPLCPGYPLSSVHAKTRELLRTLRSTYRPKSLSQSRGPKRWPALSPANGCRHGRHAPNLGIRGQRRSLTAWRPTAPAAECGRMICERSKDTVNTVRKLVIDRGASERRNGWLEEWGSR